MKKRIGRAIKHPLQFRHLQNRRGSLAQTQRHIVEECRVKIRGLLEQFPASDEPVVLRPLIHFLTARILGDLYIRGTGGVHPCKNIFERIIPATSIVRVHRLQQGFLRLI